VITTALRLWRRNQQVYYFFIIFEQDKVSLAERDERLGQADDKITKVLRSVSDLVMNDWSRFPVVSLQLQTELAASEQQFAVIY
jgi:hypothetical protein